MKIKILELTEDNFFDYQGLFETLNNLSPTSEMSREDSLAIIRSFRSSRTHLFVLIFENKIVSAATLLIEKKFIRNGALCGHIEDVATHKAYLRRGFGKKLVLHLIKESQKKGCYKVVLYCAEEVVPFYAENNFVTKGVFMERRFKN